MSSSPAPESRSLGRIAGMAEGRGLAGATGSMALGTLISKVTGFLSKIILVVALGGATDLANAYTAGQDGP